LAVRGLGPALLHAGSGANAVLIGALAAVLLALCAGWFGYVATGLGLCALGWLLRESAALLVRIEREEIAPRKGIDGLGAYAWLIDAVLVVLLAWGTHVPGNHAFLERLFPPFMLIALLRVVSTLPTGRWSGWLTDRSLVALMLMGTMLTGVMGEATHLGAVAAAVAAIALSSGQFRLTRP
jgi:hypothetical protein